MSNSRSERSEIESGDAARELGRWTDRYARSRTLGVLLFFGVFIAFCLSGASLWRFAGLAFRAKNDVLFWFCVAALVPWHILLVWFAMPWWGGKWMDGVVKRIYQNEGYVAPQQRFSRTKMRRWGIVAGVLYGASILGSVVLGLAGHISQAMMQPVSALYVVPFLVFLAMALRTHLMLLWPVLYALHALLVLAGVPIQFAPDTYGLNMLLPIAGYGFLSALVGHIYNRVALARIRRLAAEARPRSDHDRS